jgi:hypothetical protein
VDTLLASGSQAAHAAGRVSAGAPATPRSTVDVVRVPVVRPGAARVPVTVSAASAGAASGQPSSRSVRADRLSGQLTRPVSPRTSHGADAPARRMSVAARRLAGAVVSAAWRRARILTRDRRATRSPVLTRPLAANPSVRGQSLAHGGLTGTRGGSARARADTAPHAEVAMPQHSDTSGPSAAPAAPRQLWSHAHASFAGASRGGVPLLLPSPPLGVTGGVSTGSGGIGAGAAGGALLVLAALWLLHTLLPGRLTLDLTPWQSALLSLRLERPG